MDTTVKHVLAHKGTAVHSIAQDASVDEVVAMMMEYRVASIVVRDQERVLGVVTERDCVTDVLWKGLHGLGSRVGDLMRKDVPTVSPRDTIQHCMRVMTEDRVRHLPVIDDGRLVGLVSMGDVIHALLDDHEHTIETLEQYISGSPSLKPPSL
jgi:CBS domain-containing protein